MVLWPFSNYCRYIFLHYIFSNWSKYKLSWPCKDWQGGGPFPVVCLKPPRFIIQPWEDPSLPAGGGAKFSTIYKVSTTLRSTANGGPRDNLHYFSFSSSSVKKENAKLLLDPVESAISLKTKMTMDARTFAGSKKSNRSEWD